MAQRSARVNKNSYKKPFTFPTYKIYLWGILPGKSLTETKDWPGCPDWATLRTCDHCVILVAIHRSLLWGAFASLLPTSRHLPNGCPWLSDHSGWPFGKHVKFSFLVKSFVELQCRLSFRLFFQSLSKSLLLSATRPALFGYFSAKWPH